MPRKKSTKADSAEVNATTTQTTVETSPSTVESPTTTASGSEPNAGDANAPKTWAKQYKTIVTDEAKGFELGEDYRFKQRVFRFRDKPDEQTIAALKDAGFRYRAEEKSWTIQANPESRYVSDQLAQQFAGDVARSR